MDIYPLHLISYFVAVAFLMALLAHLIRGFFKWVRKAGFIRRLGGKKCSLNLPEQKLNWKSILLVVSGAGCGWAVTAWVGDRFEKTWLLLFLSGLGVLSLELWPSKRELNVLPVMALLADLHDQSKVGIDLFERLAEVVEGLPAGEVQKAVREALQRRRSGFAVEQCCRVLKGLHPFLDELVFTLRISGGQSCPAFDLALERLHERAGRQWDRTSQALLFKETIQPLWLFVQPFLYAALAFLLIDGRSSFQIAWPSMAVIGWIGLGCAILTGLLYIGFTHTWFNRILATMILAASLVTLFLFASLPHLAEIQIQEVTHLSQDDPAYKVNWEPLHVGNLEATGSGNQERKEP